jgi:glutamate-1-semialdehyde-2,1-aminomutase
MPLGQPSGTAFLDVAIFAYDLARDRDCQPVSELATHRNLERLHRKMSEKTPTSDLLHSSARELLPLVAVGTLNLLHPIYIRSAKGSRVVDVDGNEYIDLVMGFSPHILGHAPDQAMAALHEAAARGFQFAMHSPYVEPLAQLVTDAFPTNEMVLFCNSGTEATMHAIRAARAFTGKSKIAVFEGGYHGNHDYVMVNATQNSPVDAPEFSARGRGIPNETLSTVAMLPYWNDSAFDRIRSMRRDLAAVLVEPVQGLNPQTRQGPWLQALRKVCSESDVLLVFDEVITGFRLGFGGGQQFFGVPGDLVTYGKVVGGGLPCGAVAGRRDIMELYAPHSSGTSVYSAGTFNANPMTMATGFAVLTHLRSHPEAYEYLRDQSQRIASELNRFFSDNRLEFHIQHADSILFLRFRPPPVIRTARDAALDPALNDACDAFHLKLFDRGVIAPRDHQFFLSTAHSQQDVDQVIRAFQGALQEVQAEGFMEAVS